MIQRSPRNAFYRFFNGLQYVSISLVPVVGGLTKLPAEQLSKWKSWFPFIEPIGFYVQAEAWWLLLLLSGVAGISKFVCAYIGEPWVWKTIQTTLDELQSHAFKQNADPLHHHRVTLFKHKQFRFRVKPWRSKFWPWGKDRGPFSGWLVPVARSGYTTQKTKTVFLAPDDADAAEGVAGQAWSCNWMIPVSGLPDLYADQTNENIEVYAKRTWLRPDLVKKRLVKHYAMARSYLGIPIEVKGKRWGVLVLDSRSPDGIRNPEGLPYDTYKVMAKFLERLLERGVTMSNWLEISPKEFSKSEHVQIRGVSVEVFLSPFDLPEAVRGSYDKDAKKFLIEFRYIGGNEPLTSDMLESATISIGKHSKRIYKIELEQVDLTKEKKVGLRLILPKVDAVLESLEHNRDSARRAGNYKVAKKILQQRAEKLFQNQVAA